MTRAFIFPGQGSQFVGMGKDLSDAFPAAKETFQEVNEALGQNLSRLMFEGAAEDLNLTENTQPALMAMSMAVVNVLTRHGGVVLNQSCSYVAGHSLGEYAALTAAGSLALTDTAKLLKLRGLAMQEAVPVGVGAMAAILGLEFDDVKSLAVEASSEESCQIANDNSVGQVVISGHKGTIDKVIDLAKERGAKRAIILPVSAPFHCKLMAPAAQKMAEALAETTIRVPAIPVVANVTANAVSDPNDIRRYLVDQVTGMVRWRESVLWMAAQGVTEMAELGAGKVLTGLTRRIDKEITGIFAGTPEQVDALIEKLKG